MKIQVIVTIPPYADYLDEIAAHPVVSGFRLNTVMALKESKEEALKRLAAFGQLLWVDLKARQLRVVNAAIPPYTEVQLSHPISVNTPVDAFFSDGTEHVKVVGIKGNRLILADGPRRLVGPGESINIVHPSLEIEGNLTDTDKEYLRAMKKLKLNKVMLSYVENPEDVEEVKALLPGAEVILKIESQKGMNLSAIQGAKQGNLMAARGDLFVEVKQPHLIVNAMKAIIQADPKAIVASRIFDSLAYFPVPASADIGDVAFLMVIGYRVFMLGDAICFERDSVMEALNLLQAMAEDY